MPSALARQMRPWMVATPLAIAVLVLVAELMGSEMQALESTLVTVLLPLWIIVSLGAWAIARRAKSTRLSPFAAVAMMPCLLAPLGVAAAWAVVPATLGVGYGGFGFFLGWLTKYPNLGPTNYEVLLGILCVLGASAIPAAFGAYRLLSLAPRAGTMVVLLVLHLVAYVPVLVELDCYQLLFAALSLAAGPIVDATEGMGAVPRLAATIGMLITVGQRFIAARQRSLGPTAATGVIGV